MKHSRRVMVNSNSTTVCDSGQLVSLVMKLMNFPGLISIKIVDITSNGLLQNRLIELRANAL